MKRLRNVITAAVLALALHEVGLANISLVATNIQSTNCSVTVTIKDDSFSIYGSNLRYTFTPTGSAGSLAVFTPMPPTNPQTFALAGGSYTLLITNPGASASYSVTVPPCPLRNTGVSETGATCASLLPVGTVDPHWQLAIPFPSASAGPLIDPTNPPLAFGPVYANTPDLVWMPNGPFSEWITPAATPLHEEADGQYVYRITFDSVGPISGRYSSDNEVLGVYLNGALALVTLNGPTDFDKWTNFIITSGFQVGLNTLDFVVRNRAGGVGNHATVTGLRVEFDTSCPGASDCCKIKSWGQLPSGPPAQSRHAMAYDSIENGVLMFGGLFPPNNTWLFSGGTWSIKATAGPSFRNWTAMAGDTAQKLVVLFGGNSGGPRADTWEWNGAWTQRSPAQSPPARDSHAMVYDTADAVTALFGGFTSSLSGMLNDLWFWNSVSKSWTMWTTLGGLPVARGHHAMAYDRKRNVIVLFGGDNGSGTLLSDTWEWNGTWRKFFPATVPPARALHQMVYDETCNRVVMFGGHLQQAGTFASDEWEWDGTNWTEKTPAISPAPRANFGMAYDPGRKSTVLFGGDLAGGVVANDAWELRASGCCIPPPTGMLMWLSFDEQGGAAAQDFIGGPAGTVLGGASFVSGKVANAISLDGTSQYVRIPNKALTLNQDFSIDAWIFPTDSHAGTIVTKQILDPVQQLTKGFDFFVNQGFLSFAWGAGDCAFGCGALDSINVIPLNQWSHVAVTVNRTTANETRLYVDGQLRYTAPAAITGDINNSADVLIGRSADDLCCEFFSGLIDEVEIFGRTLAPAEVKELFEAGTAGKCKSQACGADRTTQVKITRGGFRFNNVTQRFVQTITLQQLAPGANPVPLRLVLDNLSSNATLVNKTGDTHCGAPLGSSYIDIPSGTASVVLDFANPTKTGITYNTRVLMGSVTQ